MLIGSKIKSTVKEMIDEKFDINPDDITLWITTNEIVEILNLGQNVSRTRVEMFVAQVMESKHVYSDRRWIGSRNLRGYIGVKPKGN